MSSLCNSYAWESRAFGEGVGLGKGRGEAAGASGVSVKMTTSIPNVVPLSLRARGTENWKEAAYLIVSLFGCSNLERSSFTFSSLYSVTLCFQKRIVQPSLFDLGVEATIASVNRV